MVGRGVVDVEGHGGSGVLVPHATKNKGASMTRVFQHLGRNAVSVVWMGCLGMGEMEWCMVIAGLANG